MDYCSKHMDREALSFCHSCGKYFCKECLNEGKEYYYCNSTECLKQLYLETGPEPEVLPAEIPQEKEFVKFFTGLNQMDSAVFESLLNDAGIEYYGSGGSIIGSMKEFYILADQLPEVEEILKNFRINNFYYSANDNLNE